MRILVLLSTILFFITNNAFAKKINVDVNGLVCEFCAVTIDKNFMKKEGIVKDINVDLEVGKVFIEFYKGKNLSDKEIRDIIVNNGYNVVKINR